MNNELIQKLLLDYESKFKKCNILCIGDMILDHYIEGDINRKSPEAPISILDLKSENYQLGGVGNVANNLVSFKSKVTVIYLSGNDFSSKKINELLDKNKKITTLKIKNNSFIMPHKTRYINKSNHLLRVDKENLKFKLGKFYSDKMLKKVKKIIKNFDLVLLSDYSKGLFDKNLIQKIIKICHENNKFVIADPKKTDLSSYSNIDILTPNQKEITDSSTKKFLNEKQLVLFGSKVLHDYNIKNLLITRSEKGMLLINKKYTKKIKVFKNEVYDVTGAGDTVVAILGLMIAMGVSIVQAAVISNYAAGIVIRKKGTSVTNFNEIISQK